MELCLVSEKTPDGMWYSEIHGLPLDVGHDLWAFAKTRQESRRRCLLKLIDWKVAIVNFVILHKKEADL
jgi:hypothetical protein